MVHCHKLLRWLFQTLSGRYVDKTDTALHAGDNRLATLISCWLVISTNEWLNSRSKKQFIKHTQVSIGSVTHRQRPKSPWRFLWTAHFSLWKSELCGVNLWLHYTTMQRAGLIRNIIMPTHTDSHAQQCDRYMHGTALMGSKKMCKYLFWLLLPSHFATASKNSWLFQTHWAYWLNLLPG